MSSTPRSSLRAPRPFFQGGLQLAVRAARVGDLLLAEPKVVARLLQEVGEGWCVWSARTMRTPYS